MTQVTIALTYLGESTWVCVAPHLDVCLCMCDHLGFSLCVTSCVCVCMIISFYVYTSGWNGLSAFSSWLSELANVSATEVRPLDEFVYSIVIPNITSTTSQRLCPADVRSSTITTVDAKVVRYCMGSFCEWHCKNGISSGIDPGWLSR